MTSKNISFFRPSRFTSRLLAGLLIAGTFGMAWATEFSGRGVFQLKSDSGCPLGTLAGEASQCNRLALDDADTSATVDAGARTIHFQNKRNYESKTIVGDVLLQGTGLTKEGQRVPLSFHLVLSKSGDKWSASSHAHTPLKGNFTNVQIDPYQIKVANQASEEVIATPNEITEALMKPALAARLANQFVQVRDNRLKNDKDADITIALGLGKAAKSLMRARLHATPAANGSIDSVLKNGNWNVELEALTSQIPRHVAQREFFLTGIDHQEILKPVLERGFKKHEKLVIGTANGKGYIRYRDQQQEFPLAEASGRAFLQQSFIGLILGWQLLDAYDSHSLK